jgi:hypothetical protein
MSTVEINVKGVRHRYASGTRDGDRRAVVFVDAAVQMLCECQINVGAKQGSVGSSLLETRNGMCFRRGGGASCMTNIGRHGVRDRLVQPGTWCCCMLLEAEVAL